MSTIKSSSQNLTLNADGTGNYVSIQSNGSEKVRIESDGDLHADGDVVAFSTTVSDERLKSDIKVIENALSKLKQISGYTFVRVHNNQKSAGVIAQELEKVLPEAIKHKKLPLLTKDNLDYKSVEYDAIHGLLIQAIKELSEKVDELERKISSKES